MKFTFPSKEKLKSRKQIAQLFEEGNSLKAFPLRLRFLKVDDSDSQIKVAFTVPKKSVKLAVNRNRIKRLMREAYRLNKNELFNNFEEKYVMMFIYTDRNEWSFADLEQKMISLLNAFIEKQKVTK